MKPGKTWWTLKISPQLPYLEAPVYNLIIFPNKLQPCLLSISITFKIFLALLYLAFPHIGNETTQNTLNY